MRCPDCGSTDVQDVISGYYCNACEERTGEEHFFEYTDEMLTPDPIEDEENEDFFWDENEY